MAGGGGGGSRTLPHGLSRYYLSSCMVCALMYVPTAVMYVLSIRSVLFISPVHSRRHVEALGVRCVGFISFDSTIRRSSSMYGVCAAIITTHSCSRTFTCDAIIGFAVLAY